MANIDKNVTEFFGETIISLGYASADDLLRALQEQKLRQTRGEKQILIGMLMVEMGMITLTQLVKTINIHQQSLNLFISEDAVRIAIHLKALISEKDKVISFSSAVAREGVTSLVSQFAIALALMGESPILLVDAHPQRANLHRLFQRQQGPGFFDILEKNIDYRQAIQETVLPTLSVMTAGEKPGSSYALFISEAYNQLLEKLKAHYRFILIDTPPVLEYPDAAVIASRTDGVVLLISAGHRSKSDIIEVKRSLDALRVRLFGYVLSE